MRIGLVSYEYPPQSGLGGVGTYTFRLAGALGRAGHEVVVLAGPNEQPDIPQKNVTLHRIPARYEPRSGSRGLRFLYWRAATLMDKAHPLVWHWLRWDMASGEALLDIHRRTPLDVIEAPEHAANGLVVGRMRRWPMVVRIHGPWDLFFGINRTDGTAMNRLLTFLERKSTHYAQVCTTPSHTMAAFIQAKWNLKHGGPTVVPNFMDVPATPAPLPRPDDVQRIVCAGRLERFKGQDTLVKAFARIARKHPNAELRIIGPDQWSTKQTFAQVVDALVPEADVRRRVVLTGPQPLAQVQDELRRASIAVICSSGFESFSFSTLEAMAAARPIVGSRVGAIPELLDNGNCGLIAAPANVAQFAECLDRLLGDAHLRQHLSKCAHERARARYDTDVAIPAMVRQFNRARELFDPVTTAAKPPLAMQPA
jgi:glycosyltransferase involved in cell wall biosynthesis